MIKKIAIGLLATIYFVVVVGVTISGHFCGGYLESYSFNIVSEEYNCCGGMPMDNDCCTDTKVTIKSSEDHFAGSMMNIQTSLSVCALQTASNELLGHQFTTIVITPGLPPPPLLIKCPVHIQNRTILI